MKDYTVFLERRIKPVRWKVVIEYGGGIKIARAYHYKRDALSCLNHAKTSLDNLPQFYDYDKV